jgi:hypothetical protein
MQGSGKHEVIELGSSDDDHGVKGEAVKTKRLGGEAHQNRLKHAS